MRRMSNTSAAACWPSAATTRRRHSSRTSAAVPVQRHSAASSRRRRSPRTATSSAPARSSSARWPRDTPIRQRTRCAPISACGSQIRRARCAAPIPRSSATPATRPPARCAGKRWCGSAHRRKAWRSSPRRRPQRPPTPSCGAAMRACCSGWTATRKPSRPTPRCWSWCRATRTRCWRAPRSIFRSASSTRRAPSRCRSSAAPRRRRAASTCSAASP